MFIVSNLRIDSAWVMDTSTLSEEEEVLRDYSLDRSASPLAPPHKNY